jgi:hypothetical protein
MRPARTINPAVCAVVPRKKPASIAEPPVGSASINNTGRGQVNANPDAEVVTPGDPAAEASTITAISSALPRIQHHGDLAGGGTGSQLCGLVVGHLDADHRRPAVGGQVDPNNGGGDGPLLAVSDLTLLTGVATTRTWSPDLSGSPGSSAAGTATPTTDMSSAGTTVAVMLACVTNPPAGKSIAAR